MTEKEKYIQTLQRTIVEGDQVNSPSAVREALAGGVDPVSVLNQGLMHGADVVGQKFETGEFFLPQLLLAGRALKAAMTVLEPELKASYAASGSSGSGVIVIATIHTDIHDIGKNIVSSMLSASGFEVHDLGVDVPIKTILAKAREVDADIIACSALLTTTMPYLRDVVGMLESTGERSRFKVIVGGASVDQDFARRIGADGTAPNAIQAVQLVRRLIEEKRSETEVQL